jgi:hypothetical protein
VCEPVTEQGVWEIITNQKLMELCKTPDLVTDIKRRNFKWAGHVVRMDQTSKSSWLKSSWTVSQEVGGKQEGSS